MSLHPHGPRRLSAIARWTLTIAAVLIAAVWVLSLQWYVGLGISPRQWFSIQGGYASLMVTSNDTATPGKLEGGLSATTKWWPIIEQFGSGPRVPMRHTEVVLWPFAILAAVPGALLWYLHLRHVPRGLCPQCHYDRAGIADDVPCPECGNSPADLNQPRTP